MDYNHWMRKKKKQAFYMTLMPYFLKIVKHRETHVFVYKSNDVFFLGIPD